MSVCNDKKNKKSMNMYLMLKVLHQNVLNAQLDMRFKYFICNRPTFKYLWSPLDPVGSRGVLLGPVYKYEFQTKTN